MVGFVRASVATIVMLTAMPAAAIDTIETQAETASATFPLIRCAGLYLGIAQALGSEGLGPDFFQASQENAAFLLAKAADMRQDDGTNTYDAITSVSREAQGFSTDYVTRAAANDARTGTAFGDDALVKADLSYCKKLGEEMSQS